MTPDDDEDGYPTDEVAIPEHVVPNMKARNANKSKNAAGKRRLNQKELGTKYSLELKKMGIHKPSSITSAKDLATMRKLQSMLKHTWAQVIENANDYKRMSERQLEFYRRYAIYGRKNKIKAIYAAGYQFKHPHHAYDAAQNNLKHPHAEDLIRAFELEEKAKMGLMVEDVANWFETIATKAMEAGDFTNANRAMESYGKYLGMFVERKEVTHKNVYSKGELDARIAELQTVISEERDSIKNRLSIN